MPLSQIDFDYVRRLVRERAAISLDDDKGYLASSRLDALARREGAASAGDLVARLRAGGDTALQSRVVEAMTVNETSFFRDGHPYDVLRTEVLPELIRARAASRRLAIWCAACSSGQEPFSIAITLREYFPDLGTWDVQILASDLSSEVVERARRARYSQMEVNRGVPAHLLIRYFRRAGLEWHLSEDVRRMVQFQQINLVGPWPAMPHFDLVLLRNVLIYFDEQGKKLVLNRVAEVLRPGGYLLLGGAETTLYLDSAFEQASAGRGGFYRLAAR